LDVDRFLLQNFFLHPSYFLLSQAALSAVVMLTLPSIAFLAGLLFSFKHRENIRIRQDCAGANRNIVKA
jgi:hypothetical protein